MPLDRRTAQERDRDFIWRIYSNAYRIVVTHQLGEWDDALQKSAFSEKWGRGGFEIVSLNATPVGAVWVTSEKTFIQLRDLFLAPEYQGQGIGSCIVRQELDRARAVGKSLKLRVLKQSGAIRFYERLGFERCGETQTQYWMTSN